MGSDHEELFKKRKGQKKNRLERTLELAPNRYLIVSEGKETETNYFEGIQRRINSKYGNRIDVKKAIHLDIFGTGRNTNDLVNHVEDFIYQVDKLANRSIIPYRHIWVIFDKDDFTDGQFNSAIEQANKNGYKVGWSNESVELWFLLHFEYLNSGISREQYNEKLTNHFREKHVFQKYKLKRNKYDKNIDEIFEILYEFGDLDKAIDRSNKLFNEFKAQGINSPAKMKPANTIYKLVLELKDYI